MHGCVKIDQQTVLEKHNYSPCTPAEHANKANFSLIKRDVTIN